MSSLRLDPWSVFDQMQRELIRSPLQSYSPLSDEGAVSDWVPPVDIVENKDGFTVHVDLPGVNAADVDVSMDGSVLSISGERQAEGFRDAAGVQRLERPSGQFFRRFTLPATISAEGVAAKFANGILEISIPKQLRLSARRIGVQSA